MARMLPAAISSPLCDPYRVDPAIESIAERSPVGAVPPCDSVAHDRSRGLAKPPRNQLIVKNSQRTQSTRRAAANTVPRGAIPQQQIPILRKARRTREAHISQHDKLFAIDSQSRNVAPAVRSDRRRQLVPFHAAIETVGTPPLARRIPRRSTRRCTPGARRPSSQTKCRGMRPRLFPAAAKCRPHRPTWRRSRTESRPRPLKFPPAIRAPLNSPTAYTPVFVPPVIPVDMRRQHRSVPRCDPHARVAPGGAERSTCDERPPEPVQAPHA